MKTTHYIKQLFAAFLLAGLVSSGCTSTEENTGQADEAANADIAQIDSAEERIDHSLERLDNKTRELERAMNDLDTTTIKR